MTSDSDVASYLINLDRSPDRLRSAATQLDRTGLRWQRIRAVDGQELGDAIASCCDAQAFARNVGRSVSASEIALCLSHIKAMQTFLEGPAGFALIFEDDLEIDDIATFKSVVDALTNRFDLWDLVKL